MLQSLNNFSQDKWKLNFSNIPSTDDDYTLMPLYDSFVKSVTLPDYNLTEELTYFRGGVIRHPLPKENVDLSQLQISFFVSENLKNYNNFFNWIRAIRHGNVDTDFVRKNTIKRINVTALDNQKREKVRIYFTNCLLLSLSSLSLVNGTSEDVEFTCNFSFEDTDLEIL